MARLVKPSPRQQTSIIQIPNLKELTLQVAEFALTTTLSPVRTTSRRKRSGFSKSLDQLGLFTSTSSVAPATSSRLEDRSGSNRPGKTASVCVSDMLDVSPTDDRMKKSLFRNVWHSRSFPTSTLLTATIFRAARLRGRRIINYEKQALQMSILQLYSSAMYLSPPSCPSL